MVGGNEKNRRAEGAAVAAGTRAVNQADKQNVAKQDEGREGRIINMEEGFATTRKRTRDYQNNPKDKRNMENAVRDMRKQCGENGNKPYSEILISCALKHKIPHSSLYAYTRADASKRRSTSQSQEHKKCIVNNRIINDLLEKYARQRYNAKDIQEEILSRQPDLEATQVKNFLRTFKDKLTKYRTARGIDTED